METNQDEQALLEQIPRDGSAVGNRTVQRKLEWRDSRYWAVRDSLVDKGLVVRGRGRGGSVRITEIENSTDTVTVPVAVGIDSIVGTGDQIESVMRREIELYKPMADVIRQGWARERRASPLAVEVTALQGRRATGGIWSRPDIVSVELKTYAYVPGKYLEVVTFEVKHADAANVQAIYEALAHRRNATHCYVLLYVPKEQSEGWYATIIDDVWAVARSHGIGLIVAAKPDDYETWEELEPAQRVEPDPSRLDEFIATQLSEATKDKVARWLR
ncbi:MAG: hypothetical protein WBL53_02460 [Pseudonocardiaceae bacterium]